MNWRAENGQERASQHSLGQQHDELHPVLTWHLRFGIYPPNCIQIGRVNFSNWCRPIIPGRRRMPFLARISLQINSRRSQLRTVGALRARIGW